MGQRPWPRHARICRDALLLWPDGQGAVGAAVLQEAEPFESETHLLACAELSVSRHLDSGEVDEAAARHLRASAFEESSYRAAAAPGT
jgi:hypothetical protein